MEEDLNLNIDNWHEIMKYPENRYVRTTIGIIKESIPKKIAALEVYKETKQSRTLALGILFGVVVVAIAGSLHVVAGALTAAVFASFSFVFIKRTIEKCNDFEERYGINPKNK